MEKQTCCVRTKKRTPDEMKDLMARLNRIEGQVRGIKNMVEEDRYCVDILTQVSAIQAALGSFNKELLESHIRTCVAKDVKEGREDAITELCETIKKMMK